MAVGFTTAYVINAYHHRCCEFEFRTGRGVQHYVISDLRQVGGFLRVLWFLSPIKLTATIKKTEILLKVALNTIKQTNKQTNKQLNTKIIEI